MLQLYHFHFTCLFLLLHFHRLKVFFLLGRKFNQIFSRPLFLFLLITRLCDSFMIQLFLSFQFLLNFESVHFLSFGVDFSYTRKFGLVDFVPVGMETFPSRPLLKLIFLCDYLLELDLGLYLHQFGNAMRVSHEKFALHKDCSPLHFISVQK
jgi:hypothetical protein